MVRWERDMVVPEMFGSRWERGRRRGRSEGRGGRGLGRSGQRSGIKLSFWDGRGNQRSPGDLE